MNYASWNWPGADAEYRQATALNPSSANAHYWFSISLLSMGRIDDAMQEIERAQELDPFSAAITNWAGHVLYHARRYDDALRQSMRGLEMHPDDGQFYWEIADIYEQKQMLAEPFTARLHALALANSPHVAALAEAYDRSGYSGYLRKQAEIFGLDNAAYTAHPRSGPPPWIPAVSRRPRMTSPRTAQADCAPPPVTSIPMLVCDWA